MSVAAATIVSVVTSVLFTISEILPFIKNVKANGILHLIIDTIGSFTKNESELETLLPKENIYHVEIDFSSLEKRLDEINLSIKSSKENSELENLSSNSLKNQRKKINTKNLSLD